MLAHRQCTAGASPRRESRLVDVKRVNVTLIGKPGCHLCDDARDVVTTVLRELESDGIAADFGELSILDDEQLARMHSEDIPVVMIGTKRHAIWRIDREKFAAAVRKAATARFSIRR